eukprot:gene19953-21907_t
MDDYKQVKIGKLKLKGSTQSGKKKTKVKKRKHGNSERDDSLEILKDEDCLQHGGWWAIKEYSKLQSCNIALQTYKGNYVIAKDNGSLSLGDIHDNNTPQIEEIFTLVVLAGTKIAFKSGYGKYISVNSKGDVMGRSDAIGPQEQFDVVIEDEKTALQGHNGYFLTVTDSDELMSLSAKVRDKEIFRLRSNTSKIKKKKEDVNEDDVIDAQQCEINYVKKFQSFQDHKLRLTTQDVSKLEKAKGKGKLHEAMLDRREKMKADRYCK